MEAAAEHAEVDALAIPSARSASPRLPALDAAKGIAILLVVFGHVRSSMIKSDRATETALHLWIDAYIYTFHVPVFYISGALMRDPRRPGFFANLPAARCIRTSSGASFRA